MSSAPTEKELTRSRGTGVSFYLLDHADAGIRMPIGLS